MVNEELHTAYSEYCVSCAGANRELWYRALEYEEYFDDMTFQPESIISEYIRYKSLCEEGEWVEDYDDFYMGLDENYIRVFVEEPPEVAAGIFIRKDRKIVIAPKFAEDKAILLHEMIHAHEYIVNECNMAYYHDILTLCLYNHLKGKVPDLDARILDHTHVIHGHAITHAGGTHDILFFLKSLDLDLRCGYKLGTVCGYGRDEFASSVQQV